MPSTRKGLMVAEDKTSSMPFSRGVRYFEGEGMAIFFLPGADF